MEWRETTLGEICDEVKGIIQTGPFGSQLHQYDYSTDGIPVVMPKDTIDGLINATKGIFITTSDFSKDANDYVSKIESKIILTATHPFPRKSCCSAPVPIRGLWRSVSVNIKKGYNTLPLKRGARLNAESDTLRLKALFPLLRALPAL